jgi:GTPase involved in cell partitioning and DNA repair
LIKELELYDSNLLSKPSILAINKIDTNGAGEKFDKFLEQYENYESKILV